MLVVFFAGVLQDGESSDIYPDQHETAFAVPPDDVIVVLSLCL